MKNKDECQAMGVKVADKDYERDNAVALALRKLGTHASDKVAELAQQVCNEIFGVEFHDTFSCSVQDLAASGIAKELQVDKVEDEVHQGGKVGASSVGELTRTVSEVNLLTICIIVAMQSFKFNLVYFLQSFSGSD